MHTEKEPKKLAAEKLERRAAPATLDPVLDVPPLDGATPEYDGGGSGTTPTTTTATTKGHGKR